MTSRRFPGLIALAVALAAAAPAPDDVILGPEPVLGKLEGGKIVPQPGQLLPDRPHIVYAAAATTVILCESGCLDRQYAWDAQNISCEPASGEPQHVGMKALAYARCRFQLRYWLPAVTDLPPWEDRDEKLVLAEQPCTPGAAAGRCAASWLIIPKN